MDAITTYRARKIITMDPNHPKATHIAVANGIILAVGGPEIANQWGKSVVHDQFCENVIMPGLVEAHAHAAAGGIWRYRYCGHYPRLDPQGKTHPGFSDRAALLIYLQSCEAEMAADQTPFIAWGYDPNFVAGQKLTRQSLDQISKNRAVIILHSNFHLLTANSRALDAAGISKDCNLQGVMRDQQGEIHGELREFAAMTPVLEATGASLSALLQNPQGISAYGQVARHCGVTTAADLLSELDDSEIDMLRALTSQKDFPIRYVPIMNAMTRPPKEAALRAREIAARGHAKLHLGRAKLFTDGAIQGRTAQLQPPGYFTGEDCGIWNMERDHFYAAVKTLHEYGVKTHIHANGDAASKLAIDAYEKAIQAYPYLGTRHTLEHVQLADKAQFQRMAQLGLCVNLFANHLYYFADLHFASTLGPNRTHRMNACADALEVFGGNFAIHSDAPVTPMAPLFTAWCAINRVTAGGRELSKKQAISPYAALRCITLGAAYVLGLEEQIGSLTVGKRADFCVLGEDPLGVLARDIKDIPVLATILDGSLTN